MSYDAVGTGSVDDPSGFSGSTQFDSTSVTPGSSDDGGGGSQNFTPGTSLPGGGTRISGNTITGGRIISDTTIGRGDYDRNSQQYKDYLEQTGRSLQNPYGNTGIFSNLFGADKVNYNLDPTTAQNILDAGFQRFSNFEGQDELSQRRGFGKLFGGPEGEMTAQGEVRKQITPMTTEESMGRALASVMGLGLPVSMIEGGNVGYAPMGGGQYNPQLDPQVNPDATKGGGIMDLLSGGADVGGLGQTLKDQLIQAKDIITSKFSPPEVAAQQNKAMGAVPTFDPRAPDAMSQNKFPNDPTRQSIYEGMIKPGVNTVPLPDGREVLIDNGRIISMDNPFKDKVSAIEPTTQDRMMAAMLGGMDRASAAPSAPSGLGNPTATAKVYGLDEPGVIPGLSEAGGGYKVQDIQEQLDKGRTGTFDSTTGKVQLSIPGTAFGLSYDLSDELGLSSGFDIDNLLGNIQGAYSGTGVSADRVTGSGNFQQGPAFMQGIGTLK